MAVMRSARWRLRPTKRGKIEEREEREDRTPRRPGPAVVFARTGMRLHALLNQPSKRKRPPAVSPVALRGARQDDGEQIWIHLLRQQLVDATTSWLRSVRRAQAARGRRGSEPEEATDTESTTTTATARLARRGRVDCIHADYWLENTEEDPAEAPGLKRATRRRRRRRRPGASPKECGTRATSRTRAGTALCGRTDRASGLDLQDADPRSQRRPSNRRDASSSEWPSSWRA